VKQQVAARRKLARLRRRSVLLRGMLALKTLVGDELMAPFGSEDELKALEAEASKPGNEETLAALVDAQSAWYINLPIRSMYL
jgi:hypothetical protein